ncbi:hypothetical protein ElyMa_005506800 [Elysia marginata]|uniref:Uncharacterized protein n=1 Tax=Elysia marginata TaxID=1093978 RepID=A0AAV4EV86_9GAST|nr:hypothetical protein ElyMa_005506800 [Elysia marginata]
MATPNSATDATEKQADLVMERDAEDKKPNGKPAVGAPSLDSSFYQNFMDPMTQELEKNVAKTNALLDKINR